MGTYVIGFNNTTSVIQVSSGNPSVITPASNTYVISAATQGPAGPAGQTVTAGSTLSFPASVNISQYQVVALISGSAEIADSSNMNYFDAVSGICIAGTLAGASCPIQYTGEISDTAWTWVPNVPIFLGTLGTLTQTPPSVGFSQQIAIPLSATTILISIANPIVIN